MLDAKSPPYWVSLALGSCKESSSSRRFEGPGVDTLNVRDVSVWRNVSEWPYQKRVGKNGRTYGGNKSNLFIQSICLMTSMFQHITYLETKLSENNTVRWYFMYRLKKTKKLSDVISEKSENHSLNSILFHWWYTLGRASFVCQTCQDLSEFRSISLLHGQAWGPQTWDPSPKRFHKIQHDWFTRSKSGYIRFTPNTRYKVGM